jgi:hypothetical protein
MTTMQTTRTEFLLLDSTHVRWPGVLPYRDPATRRGRGYATREDAEARARVVRAHYAATHGCGGPDLRVVEREVGGGAR